MSNLIINIFCFSAGTIVGIFFIGLVVGNKFQESWHNGYRAGKYGAENNS